MTELVDRCEFRWGSHGCGLPAGHEGDHRCVGENGCGDAAEQGEETS